MGTRSLTRVIPIDTTEKMDMNKVMDKISANKYKAKDSVINLYRQYDGYLCGAGLDIAEFLKDFRIVNGLRADDKTRVANGPSCLAAQLVAHFKTEPGNYYLEQFKNEIGYYGEEFIYNIYVIDYKHLVISVYDVYKKKYDVYLNPEEIVTKAKNILKSFPR